MIPHLLLRNSAVGSDKNLCFTNAAVQVLRNVKPFREKCNEYFNISETHEILKQILEYEGTNNSVSAHPLRKKIVAQYPWPAFQIISTFEEPLDVYIFS